MHRIDILAILALLGVNLFPCAASASTLVPAGAVSGSWTLAGSPYYVYGDIFVPSNQALTIDAGVQVWMGYSNADFRGDRFTVGSAASLTINGEPESPVVLKAGGEYMWGGFVFESGSTVRLDNFYLTGADNPLWSADDLQTTHMDHGHISGCSGHARFGSNVNLEVDSLSVSNNLNLDLELYDRLGVSGSVSRVDFHHNVGRLILNNIKTVEHISVHDNGPRHVQGNGNDPTAYFRRSMDCAIDGSWSLLSGLSAAEASLNGFINGAGYGNNLYTEVEKHYYYPGSGNVLINYDIWQDTVDDFDFVTLKIDPDGPGPQSEIVLAQHATYQTTQSVTLEPGVNLRSTPGMFTLKFVATADLIESDQDGWVNTACGLGAVDNIQLSGAVSDLCTFETDTDGWNPVTVAPLRISGGLRSIPPSIVVHDNDPDVIELAGVTWADNMGVHRIVLGAQTPAYAIKRLVVGSSDTLVVPAGTVLKCEHDGIDVYGCLLTEGTSGRHCVVTSIADDNAGGDSYQPSIGPAPGDHGGITIFGPKPRGGL